MSISIKIEGLKELRAALTNIEGAFDVAVGDAVEDTALAIRTKVVSAIQKGPASGRTYKLSNPARTHQASAPGQPPMTDTGRLVGSIYFDTQPLTATVGSRLAYAHYLEFGTRRMAPRPIWLKTAKEEGERLRDRIKENLRDLMK